VDRATRQAARQTFAAGQSAVVVEVLEARGSAPRAAGTRMLVLPGRAVGTIGGGHLEARALQTARAVLGEGSAARRSEHFALGPALGQCCGGAVTLAYEALSAESLAHWPEPAPLFHLQLYGAGHVGRAIATLLATLDVELDWIDEREEEFPPLTTLATPWPAHIRQVCVDAVEAEVRTASAGAFYLVLTHDHDLDLRIAEAVLRRGDFAFCGLIGSQTKRAKFARHFEKRGIAAATIARMTCPIGLPGIDGKAPEVIAAAVVAQLLLERSSSSATLPAVASDLPAAHPD
jgi:xanthine dehydrogenase accessory factor